MLKVQWPCLMSQHIFHGDNTHQERYPWHLREFHQQKDVNLFNRQRLMSIWTLRNTVNQKIENHAKISLTNIRNRLLTNTRKFSLKNEYLKNNTCIQIKSPSTMAPSNLGDGNNSKTDLNKLMPDLNAIEKCAVNGSYCLNVDNYPRQEIFQIFRSSKFMSTNRIVTDNIEHEMSIKQTKNSIDRSSTVYKPICESKEEVIFPEAGLSKNNEWLYIVQIQKNKNNFKQGVKVETCLHRKNSNEMEASCKFNEYLPEGFSSVCVQKYIYKKLITVDNSKEMYYEQFLFPSCCTCMYSDDSTDYVEDPDK